MSASRPVMVVLRALGLGDLLTSVPALRALARAFPGHRRLLALPMPLAPLAQVVGAVDDVIAAEPLCPLTRAPRMPDVAVNLHGSGPQSHRLLLSLRPRRLIAFANADVAATAGSPAWDDEPHEVSRWCGLLEASGIPADPDDLDLVVPGPWPAEALGATIIHPGAASHARRWPAERWSAVAAVERRRGRQVIVTGSADEVWLARNVAAAAGLPASAVYAGQTGVLDLARLVAVAGRVLSGDTGIAHLATALRRPSVVLFGPVAPSAWGPPPGRPWHRVLWSGTTGPRWSDAPDPGLLKIRVDDVLEALEDLPGVEPAHAAVPAPAHQEMSR